MIPKPFSEIGPDDIRQLIEDQVKESRTLDYKQALPQTHQKDKVDFLKDVAGLANTEGGDILFGLSEKREGGKTTGEPEAVVGLQGFLADQEIRRLEDTIRTGLKPRLTGVRLRPIMCPEGPVLHMRVERSLAGPHMVLHDEERFWGRGAMGNFKLDPDELRRLFLRNADLPERIRRFRNERLGVIQRGETPVMLRDGPRMVMHVVSVTSFDLQTAVDIQSLTETFGGFTPVGTAHPHGRYNIDGHVSHFVLDPKRRSRSYTQVFRNGAVESAYVFPSPSAPGEQEFYASHLVKGILKALPQYLRRLVDAGVGSPHVVLVSLLGVKGLPLPDSFEDEPVVDRDDVLLPDLLLPEIPASFVEALKPVFDAMWQSVGQACWPEYAAWKVEEAKAQL